MEYSSNLEVLLNQPVNNLTTQYKPDENLNDIEPPSYRNKPGFPNDPYYRVYTDTTRFEKEKKIEQILSIKLYTREMKTALIKRRMETYNKEFPEYNEHRDNDIRFNHLQYITKPEYYSIMFHLIELGDIIPSNYGYININDEIKKNKELMEWLPDIFKNSTKREERRRMLSFKYLVDKLEVNFDEPIRQVLTGELLSKARKTINYEKKRNLVLNNLDAFRQFTKDPNHFNVVKDLDYFFLVFESFFGEAKSETPPEPETLPAKTETTATETTAAIPPETTAAANLPETTAPETTAATTAANLPETTAPETTAANPPETTAPETTAPETTAPETTAEPTAEEIKNSNYQLIYNLAIDVNSSSEEEINNILQENVYFYDLYYLYSKMNETDQITQEKIDEYDRENYKDKLDGLGLEQKKQIIYGFLIAELLTPLSQSESKTKSIIQLLKEKKLVLNDWLISWAVFYHEAREYNKLMRKIQSEIEKHKLAESIIAAKNIQGDEREISPLYYNGVLQDPPYESFDGVFIVDKQVSARCGLHAINNLLQLKNPDCFATVDSCKLGNVLLGDRASDGNYLQSQQIVALINGEKIQVGTQPPKQFKPFLNKNYNAKFLNPDYDYDRLRETEDDKSFIGIIERNPEYRGHFVAWLLKKHGDQEYWYNIDSFGSIIKYYYDEGIIVLKSRLKVVIESLAAANLAYEHIAVYGGDLRGTDCFDLKLPEGSVVEDLGLGVATGGTKNKKNKNKSKKLYTSNKRLVKKSKKVRYN